MGARFEKATQFQFRDVAHHHSAKAGIRVDDRGEVGCGDLPAFKDRLWSIPVDSSALRSSELRKKPSHRDAQGLCDLKKLNHVKPSLAALLFGDERLWAAQPRCERGLA